MNPLRLAGAALVAAAAAGCATPTATEPSTAAASAASTASTPAAASALAAPFAQQFNTLSNGIEARNLSFASANPASYEDIIARRQAQAVMLEAKLFLPKSRNGKVAAVIITPGSAGVSPANFDHARALTDAGIAVLVVDPFGGRGVRDTIAAQDQFPFAASTYDIFAAMRALEREATVDTGRLGAMGYSRGGISVLNAAIVPLAQAGLVGAKPLRAVLAGWPWCGYQFADAQIAPTTVRFVVADSDDYVSAPQCQGYASAMRSKGADVSIRLVRDARHGFGYGGPLMARPQAIKALNAPVVYFDTQGRLLDPWSQQPVPGANDKTVEKMLSPFISRGVNVGSKTGQMNDFMADMVAFYSVSLR